MPKLRLTRDPTALEAASLSEYAMSEENVEIVRRIYGEGLIDRDPKRFVDDFATPDIEYVNPPEALDPGIRRGRAEVRLALRRARQSSPSYRHELRELFDLGDTVVAAVSRHTGPPSSEIIQEEAHTWALRDGKVVRFERGRNLEAALEAAGVSE
jgi:ketosteroid isomerase-like protein